jgi:hypothetical protein
MIELLLLALTTLVLTAEILEWKRKNIQEACKEEILSSEVYL